MLPIYTFIKEHGLTVLFGVVSAITSIIAARYRMLEYQKKIEEVAGEGRQATIFLSRAAMLKQLLRMYVEAKSGEVVWGQCVGCSDYSSQVRIRISEAASRGVTFRMIINRYAPSRAELAALYTSLRGASVVEGLDNALRIQGVSDREVILGLPAVDSYTGVLIRDEFTVRLLHHWFDERFNQLLEDQINI